MVKEFCSARERKEQSQIHSHLWSSNFALLEKEKTTAKEKAIYGQVFLLMVGVSLDVSLDQSDSLVKCHNFFCFLAFVGRGKKHEKMRDRQ